jgi:toxin YoeB
MRSILFTPIAFDQYNEWLTIDKKLHARLQKLILETAKTPFEGTGKPEPLKYELKGLWSRRINEEHRLVYRVLETHIEIIACRYHYN